MTVNRVKDGRKFLNQQQNSFLISWQKQIGVLQNTKFIRDSSIQRFSILEYCATENLLKMAQPVLKCNEILLKQM